MQYLIVLHTDDGSSYGVTVPDLPGCFSGAETFEEALLVAKEAIAFHIEGILLDRESIPDKQPYQVHQANEDFADGIWALVDVDMSKLSTKAARVNISVPSHLLTAIDEAAAQVGESRSGFLVRSALANMKRIDEGPQ